MIKYPNGKGNILKTKTSTSQRGMSLEEDINHSNQYYLSMNKAVIHKKPTPIQIVTVDYPKRSAAKIVEAYFKTPSTTDYNGLYRGRYIDFEAKQVANKTKFVLHNIHAHQLTHLMQIKEHGGIAFLLIGFTAYDEVYLIDAQIIIDIINDGKNKSILYEEIKHLGYLVSRNYLPRLDYLSVVDAIYFETEED